MDMDIKPTKKDPNASRLNTESATLKTLTYNIEGLSGNQKVLINYVRELDPPDILCLLNVKEPGFNYLCSELTNYVSFQVFIAEGDETGTVIMCNKKTIAIAVDDQPYYFEYPRGPGRIIGTGIVHLKTGLNFNVLTADVTERHSAIQIETLFKVLDGIDNYILMGDLELVSLDLETRMKDTWIKMGCPSKVRLTTNDTRLTRTYYNSRLLIPKAISLIGTKSRIGSHHGLETTFRVVAKQTRKK
jgi:hypothetical protein